MSENEVEITAVTYRSLVQEVVDAQVAYFEHDGRGYYAFWVSGKKVALHKADAYDRALAGARAHPISADKFLP